MAGTEDRRPRVVGLQEAVRRGLRACEVSPGWAARIRVVHARADRRQSGARPRPPDCPQRARPADLSTAAPAARRPPRPRHRSQVAPCPVTHSPASRAGRSLAGVPAGAGARAGAAAGAAAGPDPVGVWPLRPTPDGGARASTRPDTLGRRSPRRRPGRHRRPARARRPGRSRHASPAGSPAGASWWSTTATPAPPTSRSPPTSPSVARVAAGQPVGTLELRRLATASPAPACTGAGCGARPTSTRCGSSAAGRSGCCRCGATGARIARPRGPAGSRRPVARCRSAASSAARLAPCSRCRSVLA